MAAYAADTAQTEQVIVAADEIATQDEHRRQFESYQLVGTRPRVRQCGD